jgi:hypothetical protein
MSSSPHPFWQEVRAQAVAGTLVVVTSAILGGIVFLVHRVPRQLDQVIDNQERFKGRLDYVERRVESQGERIIRLEARP